MSVIFVVTPVIAVGGAWPVFAALAAATALRLGYQQLQAAAATSAVAVEEANTVAVDVENVEKLAAGVGADDALVFGNDQLQLRVARDARGRVSVHASGEGKSTAQLREAGAAFVQQLVRQYAYQKVAAELSAKGFRIVEEQVTAEQTVKIRFRKFE